MFLNELIKLVIVPPGSRDICMWTPEFRRSILDRRGNTQPHAACSSQRSNISASEKSHELQDHLGNGWNVRKCKRSAGASHRSAMGLILGADSKAGARGDLTNFGNGQFVKGIENGKTMKRGFKLAAGI